MKLFAIIFTTIFLAASSCEDKKNTVIDYNAHSRGYYLNITVKHDSVLVTKQRKGEVKVTKISKDEQKDIAKLVDAITLETIPDLKAPSEKRFYDGAPIATLKIVQGGESYQSQAFDHGEPPAEIKALVDKLQTFVKEE